MNSNIKNIARYSFCLFITLLFVSIFCTVSSPFTLDYTGDSSIFITIGRLFLEGKIPFVDFFDHKGPIIVLIQALGQLIAPFRDGLFVLETINLFVVLLIVDRLASLFLDRKAVITLLCLSLAFFSITISFGNTIEEFSLIPLFIALYITLKYYFVSQEKFFSKVFILGLCFSSLFWLRINSAGAICGMSLFILTDCLLQKDFNKIKVFIISFLLAQLPLTVVFISYFYYHDALYELLYASFLFNFKYVHLASNNKHLWITMVASIVLVWGTIMEYKKSKDKRIFLFTLSVLVCCALTCNIGYVFKHYLALLMPVFVLGLLLVLKNIPPTRRITNYVFLGGLFLFSILIVTKMVRNIKEAPHNYSEYGKYKELGSEILRNIPPNEQKEVYYYLVNSHFYPILEISPNHKYFVLQEWQGSHDATIYKEINEMMKQTPPRWVLMEKKEKEEWDNNEMRNKDFKEIIEKSYSLHAENEYFLLYRKKISSRS